MTLRLFSIEEKLAVMHVLLTQARDASRAPGSAAQRRYEIMKSISADLRARQGVTRANALDDLERAMQTMVQTKTDLGYDRGKMIAVANMLINKWPVVSQALEQFEEESTS